MGGLRRSSANLAELKRIYMRPAFRGLRPGERILRRLLTDAGTFGFERACLESGPFMKAAHRIYESANFVDRLPYGEAEVPVEFHDRDRIPINRTISAATAVTPEMDLRLAKALVRSPESRHVMQHNYDLWQARKVADLSRVRRIGFAA